MQTTVKHGPRELVVYIAFGDHAVEVRLFPFKWMRHSKRTKFARKPTPEPNPLPGFVEPEHPPQTNTAFGN